MGALAKKGWEQYLLQLQLHPLRTKAITAAFLAGCSDSVAQKLSGLQKFQWRRFLLKVLFGFMYGGPFGHFLYKLMDAIFKGKKDTKTVAKKVVLEQLTSSPWNNMMFMLYFGLVVEGRPWSEVNKKIKKDFPSVQLTAWMAIGTVVEINPGSFQLHEPPVKRTVLLPCIYMQMYTWANACSCTPGTPLLKNLEALKFPNKEVLRVSLHRDMDRLLVQLFTEV